MKKYIVDSNGEKRIVKSTQVPLNSLAEFTGQIHESDVPYCEVTTEIDDLGFESKVVTVNQDLRTEKRAEKEKMENISNEYEIMNKDIYDELEKIFGTRNAASASATYETWKRMSEKPEIYSSAGLKDLDTDEKVKTYADGKIAEADAYSIYRMKRIQQFKDLKDS